MRYPTLIMRLKYLRYYWIAANSKGHGIHSPFVFKFIQEKLNAKMDVDSIENESPSVVKLMQEIELATKYKLPKKIKRLMHRCIDQFKPSISCVMSNESQQADLVKMDKIDFAFLAEGNSAESILKKADEVLQKMHSNSWMVMQGIHSSSAMEDAWAKAKNHPKVRLTIDLFFIGCLFCRMEQKEQEHFIIRY